MKNTLLIIGDSNTDKKNETSSYDKLINHPDLHKLNIKAVNYTTLLDESLPYVKGKLYIMLLFPYNYWAQHIEIEAEGTLYGDLRYGEAFNNLFDRVDRIIVGHYGRRFKYVNPPGSIKIDRDKKWTKDLLATNGIPVPYTFECDFESANKLFDNGNGYFIKPRFGSMGKGITYVSNGRILTNYKNDGDGPRFGYDYGWSFKKLRKSDDLLKQILFSKPVIEREIKSPRIKNRKFDMRVYVLYNTAPYVYARSAPTRKPITNWSQGGRIEKKSFLKHIPKSKMSEIKKMSKKVAKILKLNFCGVDIIFDQDWNPYVLEAQSFPSYELGCDLFGKLINKLAKRKKNEK